MSGQAKVGEALSRELAARAPAGTGQVSRPAVIEVRGLRKSYDGVEAVAGIDLEVRAAFLGSNGAGKTTTVEILEGYRHRTAGDVSVLGRPGRGRAGTASDPPPPADARAGWQVMTVATRPDKASRPNATFGAALGILVGIVVTVSWAFSQYRNAGGWPAHGCTQSSWPPVPDVRNGWIMWPAMLWVLATAGYAWLVYRIKPVSENEIKRAMQRQAGQRR